MRIPLLVSLRVHYCKNCHPCRKGVFLVLFSLLISSQEYFLWHYLYYYNIIFDATYYGYDQVSLTNFLVLSRLVALTSWFLGIRLQCISLGIKLCMFVTVSSGYICTRGSNGRGFCGPVRAPDTWFPSERWHQWTLSSSTRGSPLPALLSALGIIVKSHNPCFSVSL